MSISQSHKSTPTKVTTKSLKALSEVAKVPSHDQNLVGIILDATGNYKTDDSFDYVCKIKIIDKDFNPTKALDNPQKVQPFLMIFIFTQKLKDSPVITKIGDIILLRHFNFDTYQDIVKGVHKRNKSNWYVFDAQDTSTNPHPIVGSSLSNFSMSQEENTLVTSMKQFSKHFFSNKNLLDLAWYTSKLPTNMATNKVYELKDIDLLVKIVSSVEFILDRNTYYKVAFVDQNRNIYLSELINVYGFKQMEKDTVLKLRSIRVQLVNNSYRIDFYDYSDILIVPSHFYNAMNIKEMTKDVNYDEIQLENQFLQDFHLERYEKEKIAQNTYIFKQANDSNNSMLLDLKKNFGILENFAIDYTAQDLNKQNFKDMFGSLIKKEHQNLEYSTLEELTKILKEHKSSKSINKKEDYDKVFRVKVRIEKIKYTNYKDCIQVYNDQSEKMITLDKFKGDTLGQKAIIYNIIKLKDTLSNGTLPAYLFSLDGNPNFVFDLWETLPDFSDVNNFKTPTQNLKKFSKQLKTLEKQNKQYELCLQLLRTQAGAVLFRIIDSIFWFV